VPEASPGLKDIFTRIWAVPTFRGFQVRFWHLKMCTGAAAVGKLEVADEKPPLGGAGVNFRLCVCVRASSTLSGSNQHHDGLTHGLGQVGPGGVDGGQIGVGILG
jgi:hypothetical protein